jgi:hypothetical protein
MDNAIALLLPMIQTPFVGWLLCDQNWSATSLRRETLLSSLFARCCW